MKSLQFSSSACGSARSRTSPVTNPTLVASIFCFGYQKSSLAAAVTLRVDGGHQDHVAAMDGEPVGLRLKRCHCRFPSSVALGGSVAGRCLFENVDREVWWLCWLLRVRTPGLSLQCCQGRACNLTLLCQHGGKGSPAQLPWSLPSSTYRSSLQPGTASGTLPPCPTHRPTFPLPTAHEADLGRTWSH